MSDHGDTHFGATIQALVHDAANYAEGAVLDARLHGGGVQLTCARGDHIVSLVVRQGRVGGAQWTLVARREGAAAELSVRPELVGEGFDKLLGLTIDLQVGDAAFDERFVIEAAPAPVAAHLLDPRLRAAMSRLPPSDDGPSLRVSAELLTLKWTGGLTREDLAALLRAVFECLDRCRALHEALATADARAPFRVSGGGNAAVDPEARAIDRASVTRAHRRATAFVAGAVMAGAAFIATLLTAAR